MKVTTGRIFNQAGTYELEDKSEKNIIQILRNNLNLDIKNMD
jgi:hypothetical protein